MPSLRRNWVIKRIFDHSTRRNSPSSRSFVEGTEPEGKRITAGWTCAPEGENAWIPLNPPGMTGREIFTTSRRGYRQRRDTAGARRNSSRGGKRKYLREKRIWRRPTATRSSASRSSPDLGFDGPWPLRDWNSKLEFWESDRRHRTFLDGMYNWNMPPPNAWSVLRVSSTPLLRANERVVI